MFVLPYVINKGTVWADSFGPKSTASKYLSRRPAAVKAYEFVTTSGAGAVEQSRLRVAGAAAVSLFY